MAGRASIVGAAATHVGNVRDHNEDAHFIDADLGLFLVCDGMGGHAAGEVASELAIQALRREWGSAALVAVVDRWLERGTPEAKKQLLDVIRDGVIAAHDSILAEADRDETKSGMGTTLVGAVIVGGELVFAHAGDSRAYLVRDGISMQLTEDHTLLARLLAAGIDVDVSGEGSRFRSMLTNALGIGDEVKVSTFVVPLADGDRFLLCSDGISEYVPENEVGDVLTKQPSPARAAQRLIDLALERGGGDNATAVVVRVLEAGETPLPAEQRKKDDTAINACALWSKRVTPQQRLRALRIAIPRDHNFGEKLPPHALGDRVAWIILEGELVQDGEAFGPGALIYPESLLGGREAAPPPSRDALAITRSDVRALAIRANDFHELCDDDGELGEALLDSLAALIAQRKPRASQSGASIDPRGNTDPHLPAVPLGEAPEAYQPTDPNMAIVGDPDTPDEQDGRVAFDWHDGSTARGARGSRGTHGAPDGHDLPDRAATVPDDPNLQTQPRRTRPVESTHIAPAPPRASVPPGSVRPGPPARPSPPPPQMTRRATPPPPPPPSRPSPPPGQLARPPSRPSSPPEQLARPPSRPNPPTPAPEPLAARSPGQPPSRPSPPPDHLAKGSTGPAAQASQPPAPPTQPAAGVSQPPEPPHVGSPTPGRAPTPRPAPAARSRTPTPAEAPAATARPRTPTPGHDVSRSRPDPASRATPVRGLAPMHADAPPPADAQAESPPPATPAPSVRRDAAAGKPAAQAAAATPRTTPVRSGAARDNAAAARGESPWDSGADTAPDHRSVQPGPGDVARAHTPPPDAKLQRAATPVPVRLDGARNRPPTDPEIETYLELEADLPPESGGEPDLDSEFALSAALADLDEEHESVSITIEEEGRRVIETTTETSAHTLTVTVTEPMGRGDYPRAITAEDGAEVSGSISIPEDTPPPPPPRRARRQSDGWDD